MVSWCFVSFQIPGPSISNFRYHSQGSHHELASGGRLQVLDRNVDHVEVSANKLQPCDHGCCCLLQPVGTTGLQEWHWLVDPGPPQTGSLASSALNCSRFVWFFRWDLFFRLIGKINHTLAAAKANTKVPWPMRAQTNAMKGICLSAEAEIPNATLKPNRELWFQKSHFIYWHRLAVCSHGAKYEWPKLYWASKTRIFANNRIGQKMEGYMIYEPDFNSTVFTCSIPIKNDTNKQAN